jgi:hypothetical protein
VPIAIASRKNDFLIERHYPIGVSTGYMADLRDDWPAQVSAAWKLSAFAIELSALSETELPQLLAYLKKMPALPFRYISVHGPSKNRMLAEEVLVKELLELASWAHCVVMHPDTIETPSAYRSLGRKLVIENLDSRKSWGRTADELTPLFAELPDARFCFDIAHAWSMDKEMGIANDLLDRFRDRLQQVHLSSLSEDLRHVPLTSDDASLFGPLLQRCLDVPWILEAPPSAA